MNSVVDVRSASGALKTAFDRASDLAPLLAQSTAEQRIGMIQALVKTMLAHKEEIYQAVRLERGLAPIDTDAELLMVKLEADHVAAQGH